MLGRKNSAGTAMEIIAGGGVGFFMAVPDETKRETINRIAGGTWTQNGSDYTYRSNTWTVDRSGWVFCHLYFSSLNTGYGTFQVFINGKDAGEYASATNYSFGVRVPVAKDDVVSMVHQAAINRGTPASISCYFIPPKFVGIQALTVEPGSDYSLDEQPVLVSDGGVVRQKLDYDSSPVWRRTFTGYITTTANTQLQLPLMTGVKRFINTYGEWGVGNGVAFVQLGMTNGTAYTSYIQRNGAQVIFLSQSTSARNGGAESAYSITIEYTKV